MQYSEWHQQTVKKAKPKTELELYVRVLVFGLFIFAVFYLYIFWQGLPGALNKAVADAGIVLIGLSMLLSGLCYFWDFVDTKIIYRKYLGLIGYAFALVHIGLSFPTFDRFLSPEGWEDGVPRAPLAGFIATAIFTIMAMISNKFSIESLGGKSWRLILRTGYIGVVFVWLHVYFLRVSRWAEWFVSREIRPPSLSLIMTIFMTLVVLMRIALWFSLLRKRKVKNV